MGGDAVMSEETTVVRYYRVTGPGAIRGVSKVETRGGAVVPLEDAVEITQAEYDAEVAEIEEVDSQRLQAAVSARTARAEEAYEGLLAAGVPEAAARTLAGTWGT